MWYASVYSFPLWKGCESIEVFFFFFLRSFIPPPTPGRKTLSSNATAWYNDDPALFENPVGVL